jgi:heme-degrading monooxygenase HmoA
MKISPINDVVPMINVFTVEPEKQQQVIEGWLKEGKRFFAFPGFVAASLHKSLDGTRVINYAQYQKAEDWLAISPPAEQQQLFAWAFAISQPDPHLYEVVSQSTTSGAASVTIEEAITFATMITVFPVEPEKQQQLIETWLREGKQLEALPGFVSTTLHRSLDGKQVLHYVQWQKAQDWLAISRQADSLFEQVRAVSQADSHLYEVVHLVRRETPSAG